MAAYLLLSRLAGTRHTTGAPLALAVAWAALLTVPLGVAHSGTALLSPGPWAVAPVVALLSAVVPYSLEPAALRQLPPRTVGTMQSLEPAVAGIAGALVLGEELDVVQWLALGCIGFAAAGAVTAERPKGPAVAGDTGSAGT
jgi:inner membrane transporter RhtA